MKKIIWAIAGGVVVLIIIALLIMAVFLDRIVKKGVETLGPKITGVSVNLDEIHISLLTGSARVKGFVLGNPEGYETASAINIGVAQAGVNPFSVLSDKIVIRSIHLESPEITFEGGFSGNNLGKIMDNVNSSARNGGPDSTHPAAGGKPAKKIEVDDFLVTGAKVHIRLTSLGGKETTLSLPDIHLTDLGKGSDGLTVTDLTRRVLDAITSATIKTVASKATDLGKGVEKLGGAGANQLKKSLGGLFGK